MREIDGFLIVKSCHLSSVKEPQLHDDGGVLYIQYIYVYKMCMYKYIYITLSLDDQSPHGHGLGKKHFLTNNYSGDVPVRSVDTALFLFLRSRRWLTIMNHKR